MASVGVALRLPEANELLVNKLVRSDNERSGDELCGQMDGWGSHLLKHAENVMCI
jgi:hypothetical protein